MKAVVAAFHQEKALVGAFSVITNLRMELYEALERSVGGGRDCDNKITILLGQLGALQFNYKWAE